MGSTKPEVKSFLIGHLASPGPVYCGDKGAEKSIPLLDVQGLLTTEKWKELSSEVITLQSIYQLFQNLAQERKLQVCQLSGV